MVNVVLNTNIIEKINIIAQPLILIDSGVLFLKKLDFIIVTQIIRKEKYL